MILERIHISRVPSWNCEKDELRYVGKVEYAGANGDIKLHLDDTLSRLVLDVVADQLVVASKELATKLTAAVITQTSVALPPPEGE